MDIYKIEPQDARLEHALETLRARISKTGMGVTLIGNRLTVRFDDKEAGFVNVHMVILSVKSDILDAPEGER